MTTLFDDFQKIFAVYRNHSMFIGHYLLSIFLLLVIKPKCNIERKLARYWQHTLSRSEKAVLPRGSRGGSLRRAGCLAW